MLDAGWRMEDSGEVRVCCAGASALGFQCGVVGAAWSVRSGTRASYGVCVCLGVFALVSLNDQACIAHGYLNVRDEFPMISMEACL